MPPSTRRGAQDRWVRLAHNKSLLARLAAKPPKKRVRTKPKSPSSAPGVYRFNRGFTRTLTMGDAEQPLGWLMNSDNHYMIYQNHVKFKDLTKYDEFRTLFSQYKILAYQTVWTPNFSHTSSRVLNALSDTVNKEGIQNVEIIEIPVRGWNLHDFTTMTRVQIDEFLDQSQRFRTIMNPAGRHTFKTLKPTVVKASGLEGKGVGVETYKMGAPDWYSTAATLNPDYSDITHYGTTLLIRRVDGDVLNQTSTQQLDFRATTRVSFACRKVQ